MLERDRRRSNHFPRHLYGSSLKSHGARHKCQWALGGIEHLFFAHRLCYNERAFKASYYQNGRTDADPTTPRRTVCFTLFGPAHRTFRRVHGIFLDRNTSQLFGDGWTASPPSKPRGPQRPLRHAGGASVVRAATCWKSTCWRRAPNRPTGLPETASRRGDGRWDDAQAKAAR